MERKLVLKKSEIGQTVCPDKPFDWESFVLLKNDLLRSKAAGRAIYDFLNFGVCPPAKITFEAMSFAEGWRGLLEKYNPTLEQVEQLLASSLADSPLKAVYVLLACIRECHENSVEAVYQLLYCLIEKLVNDIHLYMGRLIYKAGKKTQRHFDAQEHLNQKYPVAEIMQLLAAFLSDKKKSCELMMLLVEAQYLTPEQKEKLIMLPNFSFGKPFEVNSDRVLTEMCQEADKQSEDQRRKIADLLYRLRVSDSLALSRIQILLSLKEDSFFEQQKVTGLWQEIRTRNICFESYELQMFFRFLLAVDFSPRFKMLMAVKIAESSLSPDYLFCGLVALLKQAKGDKLKKKLWKYVALALKKQLKTADVRECYEGFFSESAFGKPDDLLSRISDPLKKRVADIWLDVFQNSEFENLDLKISFVLQYRCYEKPDRLGKYKSEAVFEAIMKTAVPVSKFDSLKYRYLLGVVLKQNLTEETKEWLKVAMSRVLNFYASYVSPQNMKFYSARREIISFAENFDFEIPEFGAALKVLDMSSFLEKLKV